MPAEGRRPAPGPERREGPAQRIIGMAVEQPRPLRLPERRRRCGGRAEKGVLPGALALQDLRAHPFETAEAAFERVYQARRLRHGDLGEIPLHGAFCRPRRRPEPGQREIPAGQDRQGGAVEPGPGEQAPERRAEAGEGEFRRRNGAICGTIQGRHASSVPDVCAIPCVTGRQRAPALFRDEPVVAPQSTAVCARVAPLSRYRRPRRLPYRAIWAPSARASSSHCMARRFIASPSSGPPPLRHRHPERHRVKSVISTASVSVSSTAKLSRRPLAWSRASPAEPGLTTRTSPTRSATCIWVWP